MLLVEALLKKDARFTLTIKNEIKSYISNQKYSTDISYHRLRGAYILMKYACPEFDESLCIDKLKTNFRFNMLYNVLLNESDFNPLYVEEEQIKYNDMLPDYFNEDYNVL
ncbi:MAG: hypothetical protein GX660_11430 [Clostridiaceae bacterium]|nr:hypothetical protein [Clostridiaceae bacterium]